MVNFLVENRSNYYQPSHWYLHHPFEHSVSPMLFLVYFRFVTHWWPKTRFNIPSIPNTVEIEQKFKLAS